jgi:hypothetical protein
MQIIILIIVTLTTGSITSLFGSFISMSLFSCDTSNTISFGSGARGRNSWLETLTQTLNEPLIRFEFQLIQNKK